MTGSNLPARTGGNYLATNDDYFAALAAEANTLKGGGDGKAFMKFDGNDGTFSYGADDEPLDLGTKLAVNMRSYKKGWVIWLDGEVVYEVMNSLEDGPPPTKGQLPDHGPYGDDDGPSEQYTIDYKLLEEPFTEMVFQANNTSKRRALAALLKDFANTYKSHPGQAPVIELDENEFEAKTKGGKGRKVTKHAPKFKIVEWIDLADLDAMTQGSPDDYEKDATPRRVSSRRDEPEAEDDRPARRASRRDEPEPEDERPARRASRRDEPEDEPDRGAREASRRDEREPEDDRPTRRAPARDEEDERPARRAAPAARDEEEDAPVRRSRRDEPAEDDPPVRRSRRDEPEPEDERPARREATPARDEPAEDAPRRRGRF